MKAITTSILFAATAAFTVGCVGDDFSHVEQRPQQLASQQTAEPEELGRLDEMPELPPSVWEEHIVNGGVENGEPATALLLAFDQNEQVFSICSGTLIAPQRVLTAAHCVDDNVNAAGFGVYFGSDATLENDPGFIFFTQATQVVFHPAWNPNDLEAGNDIGLVFLAEAPPITPIPIRRTPLSQAEVGQPVKLVGWGITSGGGEDSGLKRSTLSQLHAFDNKLMQVGDQATGTCSGDSGGPAFMNVGGQVQVVGVTSFGDVNCQVTSVDTRVDAFTAFITSDGQDPGAGNSGGFGAACNSFEDCISGLCAVSADGSGFCTRSCDGSTGSCPGGFDCVEAEPGLNVCLAGEGGGIDGEPGGGFPIPPDDDESGCSVGGAGHSGAPMILFAITLLGLRRRRRRS